MIVIAIVCAWHDTVIKLTKRSSRRKFYQTKLAKVCSKLQGREGWLSVWRKQDCKIWLLRTETWYRGTW